MLRSAILITAALANWQALPAPRSTSDVDDAAVLRAALEHTVLPDIGRKLDSRVHRVALVSEDTLDRRYTMPPTADWVDRLAGPAGTGRPMVEGATVRHQLVSSFEQRNAASTKVPPLDHPEIVLVPVARAKEFRSKYRNRTRGWTSVTLPGYSTNGRALVYVSYSCGNLCGSGWLVVLQRTRNGWRVESGTSLWIS